MDQRSSRKCLIWKICAEIQINVVRFADENLNDGASDGDFLSYVLSGLLRRDVPGEKSSGSQKEQQDGEERTAHAHEYHSDRKDAN